MKKVVKYILWLPFAVSISSFALYFVYAIRIKFKNLTVTESMQNSLKLYLIIGLISLFVGLFVVFIKKTILLFKMDDSENVREKNVKEKKIKEQKVSNKVISISKNEQEQTINKNELILKILNPVFKDNKITGTLDTTNQDVIVYLDKEEKVEVKHKEIVFQLLKEIIELNTPSKIEEEIKLNLPNNITDVTKIYLSEATPGKGNLTFEEGVLDEDKKTKIELTVAVALVKEQKMDLILQKLTELGVSKIIPVSMERSIVKLDKERFNKKKVRWESICKEASEQSKRTNIPIIEDIKSIKDLTKEDADLKLVASTKEKEKLLNYYLQSIEDCAKIIMVIGSEGGISDKEEDILVSNGYNRVSFGNLIFRVETATIYVASIINYISSRS